MLTESLELHGDEQVLDVAAGTGNAAFAISNRVPKGRVLGVDFASGMLKQAQLKAAAQNVGNIEFLEMDMCALEFTERFFDVAVCAFGIFFVEDMIAQLKRIAAAVRPGGKIAISGFYDNSFYPLADLMFARLKDYGVQKPAITWKRIATEEGCRRLFEQAGIGSVRTEQRDVGYFLDDADDWWDVIWNAGFRGLVNQLPPQQQEQFRREHLEEVGALKTDKGIWLDVRALHTFGIKT